MSLFGNGSEVQAECPGCGHKQRAYDNSHVDCEECELEYVTDSGNDDWDLYE
jgi:ribosomal protein S27E